MKIKRKNRNQEIIMKALIDPKFRKLLKEKPTVALGLKKITPIKQREIKYILTTIKNIHSQIATSADMLLCANNGPCGIA